MGLVQVEHVIGGGQRHLVPLGQHHSLQHVHRLGDVGHHHTVAMAYKGVQRQGGHQRVTHGVLLVEEAGVGARFHVVPGTPFVHNQPHAMLGIVTVHNLQVLFNDRLNRPRLAQGGVIFGLRKGGGAALVLPVRAGHGIIVHGDGVHKTGVVLHQHFHPVVIRFGRAAGDAIQFVFAVVAAIGLVTAVFVGVIFRAHVAAAAPVLVANAEVLYAVGFLAAVLPTLPYHRGIAVAV